MSNFGFLATWGTGGSVAADLAVLAMAVTIGLAVGAIRIGGLRLGISGVLFAALLFGQVGFELDAKAIDFLRDFSLIVFMYAIGLQVGPGFGASLRSDGLRLNALSLAVLVLGGLLTVAIAPLVPNAIAPGLYAGAFNTTPGLAAAQGTLRSAVTQGQDKSAGEAAAERAGLAYSITYPFGVVGPMLVIVAMRYLFRVNVPAEKKTLEAAEEKRRPRIDIADIEVTALEQACKTLRDHALLQAHDVIFTRLLRNGVVTVPKADTLVQIGDIYRAVGPKDQLAELIAAMGKPSETDLNTAPGDIRRMDLLVTRTNVLHKSLRELNLVQRTGVTVSQIHRAGIELMPTGPLRLAFGDKVVVVGPKSGLDIVETELGNSPQRLNQPQLVPVFMGIVLGVMVGSIPIAFPGLHGSIHIGLAGGSLLAAIALSRLGSVGSVVWYMPPNANQLFRDFGLAIFLACVGFQAGDHFIQRAAANAGLSLLVWGALITVIPVFLVACFARIALKMNFILLCGWISGAMSSSTTLLFSEEITGSSAPAVAYAAVLPLAELVPIICSQVLAIVGVHH